jgi:hypothetical protein
MNADVGSVMTAPSGYMRIWAVLSPAASPNARSRAANGFHTKLRGQGPRAEVVVARRLPRILLDSNA